MNAKSNKRTRTAVVGAGLIAVLLPTGCSVSLGLPGAGGGTCVGKQVHTHDNAAALCIAPDLLH